MNLRNDITILTILFQFKKYSHKNDCINKNTHTKYIITNKHFPTGYSHNHLYQTEKTIQAGKCHRKHQNIQYNTPNGLFHLCLQGFNTIRNIPLCHTIKKRICYQSLISLHCNIYSREVKLPTVSCLIPAINRTFNSTFQTSKY